MSIGFALLLSTILLSLAIVVVATRHTIRWGMIFGIVIATTVAIVLAFIAYFWYTSQPFYQRVKVYEIGGVRLSDTHRDVLFKVGKDPEECLLQSGVSRLVYDQNEHSPNTELLIVELFNDTVFRVEKINVGNTIYLPRGMAFYKSSIDRVVHIYGSPSATRHFDNPELRVLYFDEYNLGFRFLRNETVSVVVYDPKILSGVSDASYHISYAMCPQ